MFTFEHPSYQIITVGAGGTGGWLVSFLDKIKDQVESITIIDGDFVEDKNLVRQNFQSQHIGQNKAVVLSEKYGMKAYPQFIRNVDDIYDLVDASDATPIIVGCVDNNESRKLISDFIEEYDGPAIWVDGGNGENHGQTILYALDENGQPMENMTHPFELFPDLQEISDVHDLHPETASCAEMSESTPQNMVANVMSATSQFNLINLIISGSMVFHQCYQFSSVTNTIFAKQD